MEPPSNDVNLLQMSATPGCTEEQIKSAYRRQAQRLHPDHGGDAERFRQLQHEYEVALKRINQPLVTQAHGPRYVPTAPATRRPQKRLMRRVVMVLVTLSMMALVLPPNGRIMILLLLPAVIGLFVIPLLLSSLKPHISGLLFLMTAPIWIAVVFAVGFNERFGKAVLSPETAEFGDYVLLAIVAAALSFLTSTFLGMMFAFANSH